jgi:AAA ATPase domain
VNAAQKDTLANLLPSYQIRHDLILSRGNLPEELKTDILTANSVKILVAGQRGMGKTIELRRLEALLKATSDYYPIFLQFGAEENIDDVNLVYTMAQALLATGDLSPKRGSVVAQWFDKEETVSSYTETKGGGVGINANVYIVHANVGAKTSRDNKTTKTKTVVKQKRDLIQAFNELIEEFRKAAKKQVVFIVDDIDKIQNLASVEATFINSAQLIGNIAAPCVFTVPFTYATSSYLRLASLPYENIHRVPAVAVNDIDGTRNSDQCAFLAQLIKKRLVVDYLTEDHLEKIVQYSGGVIVDALRLARGVVKQIVLSSPNTVDQLVDSEFQKIADEYIYQIDKPILWQKIHKFCTTDDPTIFLTDDATVDLVIKMIVIEYRQHTTWHKVHPAVRRLYEQNKDQIATHLPSTGN